MRAKSQFGKSWRNFFAASAVGFFLLIAGLTFLGPTKSTNLVWLFTAHMAFGLSVAGLLCEHFQFNIFSIYNSRQGVAALLALSVFELSDFLWGGAIFGSSYQLSLVFLLIGGGAFACVYFYGQRSKQ